MGFLSNLFVVPGSSAVNHSIQQQGDLAAWQEGQYRQYMPELLQNLQQLYSPNSGLFQELDANAVNAANAGLLRLGQRGVNPISSAGGNLLTGVYGALARNRGQLALQGLQTQAGLISPLAGQAAAGYGAVGQAGAALGQQSLGMWQGIGSLVGAALGGGLPVAGMGKFLQSMLTVRNPYRNPAINAQRGQTMITPSGDWLQSYE